MINGPALYQAVRTIAMYLPADATIVPSWVVPVAVTTAVIGCLACCVGIAYTFQPDTGSSTQQRPAGAFVLGRDQLEGATAPALPGYMPPEYAD